MSLVFSAQVRARVYTPSAWLMACTTSCISDASIAVIYWHEPSLIVTST